MSVSTTSSAWASVAAELVHQVARPRIAMRLERDHQARGPGRARGGHHRRDLRRVVTVVVHHGDAVDDADVLEATLGAAKVGQGLGDALERDLQLEADGHGGQGVQHRVPAGHLQGERTEGRRGSIAVRVAAVHDAPRAEAFEHHVPRAHLRVRRVDAVGDGAAGEA